MDWAEPSAISAAIPKAAATIAVAVPVERTMLAVYLLGCAVMLTRLVLSRRRLLNLETQAVPFAHRDEVRLTDHPITPFVGPHRSVVVPAILVARLTRRQLDLVIEHENIHIERRDPQWFLGLSVLDALFWFHPWVRHQTKRCRLAAELAVDARVREVDPRLYASTLIDAVKHTAGAQLSQVPAAARGSDMRIRIQRVLRPHAKAPRRWRLAIASVLLFPIIAAQWSVVYATTKGPPSFEITPVEGRITSKFGRVPGPKKKKRNHTGIDISAPSGTPIVAPAAGRVVQAERSKVKYGNLLVLDHGNGFVTRYAHLKSFEVNVNDRVAVG
ncbi:MAG: M23/M56 family metallopeptidase, partial [Myxococcota bacterium]